MAVRKKKKKAAKRVATVSRKKTVTKKKRRGGSWKKGQSGNPSGRPRTDAALRDAAREYTEAALLVLANALTSDSGDIQIKAAKEILDRGWGKPRQSIDLGSADGSQVASRLEVVFIKPDGSIGDGKG
jgi:hypothetical protein